MYLIIINIHMCDNGDVDAMEKNVCVRCYVFLG